MYIARILYPVEVLGPGIRVGIWFCGCPHGCEGCCNPELWEFQEKYKTSVSTLIDLVKKIVKNHPVDGFTITGGEPFWQGEDFLALTGYCVGVSSDIFVYSGYLKEEIPEKYLKNVAVLMDGKYRERENYALPLRGSQNQTLHFLRPEYRERYENYLISHESQVQLFETGDGVVSVGIHRPRFKEELDIMLKERGVE